MGDCSYVIEACDMVRTMIGEYGTIIKRIGINPGNHVALSGDCCVRLRWYLAQHSGTVSRQHLWPGLTLENRLLKKSMIADGGDDE